VGRLSAHASVKAPALERLRAFVEERAIDTFRAGGATIDGAWRTQRVPAAALLTGEPIAQPDAIFATDVAFDWYEPRLGYSGANRGLPDLALVPDLSTVRALPWEEGTATVICDHVEWDGTPVEISPRHVLSRVVERCRSLGYEPLAAVELELYVYRETPETLRQKGYTRLAPLTPVDSPLDPIVASGLLRRWTRALEDYGLAVAGASTETGPSHLELNLAHRPALEAADAALMYKHALRELAAQEALTVTFMARPEAALPPSSSHVHVSLWEEERNSFWDGPAGSRTLRAYVAGALASLRELALLALPTVNSYRRIAPYRGSPTGATWGFENRTAALRVLAHTAGAAASSTGWRARTRTPTCPSRPRSRAACTESSACSSRPSRTRETPGRWPKSRRCRGPSRTRSSSSTAAPSRASCSASASASTTSPRAAGSSNAFARRSPTGSASATSSGCDRRQARAVADTRRRARPPALRPRRDHGRLRARRLPRSLDPAGERLDLLGVPVGDRRSACGPESALPLTRQEREHRARAASLLLRTTRGRRRACYLGDCIRPQAGARRARGRNGIQRISAVREAPVCRARGDAEGSWR